jgi:nickel-dependent lactate racemase
MEQYFLQSHSDKTYFKLPGAWRVLKNVTATACQKTTKTISQLVNEALANPTGTQVLSELLKGKEKITIIVDDPARPTPKKAILLALLDYLHQCGIKDNRITAIIGLGTHGPLSESEIRQVYGEDICKEIKVLNHNCHADDLVTVGNLKHGGDLKINKLVAEADFRIAVGSVLPHPFAGFGGGAKSVLPSIAGYETIKNHHMSLMLERGVFVGNTDNNPFLAEIREAGRLAKLDFIINAIYDAEEDVKNVVAGHFIDAHNIGAELCRKELGVYFDEPADVTLMSAFPYTDGPQVMKPLSTSNVVTKEGGIIILYASKIKGGGFPSILLETFDSAFAKARGDLIRLVMEHIEKHILIVPGIQMDFNSALNCTLLYLSRTRMILVSEDCDEAQAARLGFEYARSVQDAIDKVVKGLPRATVNILPMGGVVMPIVPESMLPRWK